MQLILCAFIFSGCGKTPSTSEVPLVATTSAPQTAPLAGGPTFPAAAVVNNLPWLFTATTESFDDVNSTLTTFVSSKPIEASGTGTVSLKASLKTTSFEGPANAAEAFSARAREAHPDTGLTYAWDLVVLDGPRLYHLHADCLFSVTAFDTMSANLLELIGRSPVVSLRCRCGGGCTIVNDS